MSDRDLWETEMNREFEQRVRDLHEAPLSLDRVKGRAGRIRRTRRLATAGGVLAAAAAIVPVLVLAGGGATDDSGPDPAPSPTAVDPSGPGFGYLEGRTLHRPDGTTTELPERYQGATLLDDAVLAVRSDDTGRLVLDEVDPSGAVVTSSRIRSGPVTNDDGSVVAWLGADGTVTFRWEGGGQIALATELDPNAMLAAVTGRPGCSDCSVYVNDGLGGPPRRLHAHGDRSPVAPDAIRVSDVSEAALATVQNESTDDGSCGGVYDLASSRYLWETCDAYLFHLAPGSQHLDATHPYLDGLGNGYAAILDADSGSEVARLEPPGGTVVDTAWQDQEHLLASVHGPEGWSIYRLGVDGEVEQVVGPSTSGDELDPAYLLLGGW